MTYSTTPLRELRGLKGLWQYLITRSQLKAKIEIERERELLSRPVDQDLLGGFRLGVLAGSFDEFAVDEGRSGADQGDEVGCVDGAPAVLR